LSRILFLTAYFPPDNGSAAHLFWDLGTELVRLGHQVTVVTSMPGYHAQGQLDQYRGKRRLRERLAGMDALRVATIRLPPRLMVGRAVWQFSLAACLLREAWRLPRHDVALVYSPPLSLGLTAAALRWSKKVPFVLNVQDLFPRSIIDLGLLRNRVLIAFFEGMERFVYARADHIAVHSPGNQEHVIAKGAAPSAVTVVANWVDTDAIQPGIRMNGFRRRQGLDNSFIVSFAGIIGFAQDLDVVLEAAAKLQTHPGIVWLIVGDGVEKPRLEQRARTMGLPNVRFLSMQPREEYAALLAASDVCLVTLNTEVRTPVVPSKILSIMAAGRPVVAALDLEGDAVRIIEDGKCGFAVPAGDAASMADAVLRLYHDRELRGEFGRNGRHFAETHFSLKGAAGQYNRLLLSIVHHDRKD